LPLKQRKNEDSRASLVSVSGNVELTGFDLSVVTNIFHKTTLVQRVFQGFDSRTKVSYEGRLAL